MTDGSRAPRRARRVHSGALPTSGEGRLTGGTAGRYQTQLYRAGVNDPPMDRVDRYPRGAGTPGVCDARAVGTAAAVTVAVGAALALVGASGGAAPGAVGTDLTLAAPLVVGVALGGREGLGALVGGIVGGALIGGGAGFLAHTMISLPFTQFGAAGMGVALGGGLGGLTYFLSVGEADQPDESGVRVDMGRDDDPEPRPADLFDDHPDPVLYVADEGGGPVVRAANAAYGETFDLPTDALSGAPLTEVLRPADDGSDDAGAELRDALAAGETVDRDLALATARGVARFRVRSVGNPADGYLLFTPVEPLDTTERG